MNRGMMMERKQLCMPDDANSKVMLSKGLAGTAAVVERSVHEQGGAQSSLGRLAHQMIVVVKQSVYSKILATCLWNDLVLRDRGKKEDPAKSGTLNE